MWRALSPSPSRRRLLVASIAALALVLASCDEGDTEPGGDGAAPANGDRAAPEEVEQFSSEWPHPNRDYEQTRATTDASIDSDNVDSIEVAWTFDIPGSGAFGAAASAPVIADGVVYFQDLGSNVFAIDLETGEEIWSQRFDVPVVGPNGPAIGYGKVFAHTDVDAVSALDSETGEEVWTTTLDGPTGAHQPVVFDGLVYTATQAGAVASGQGEQERSVRGYAPGSTGYIYALDQETGEAVWRFQVVEEGFWGNPDVNSGGGVWFSPAIDPDTGMTFWGTGNPAPFPGTEEHPNGQSRPGRNLFTNSMLALTGQGGELEWFRQVKAGDLFDLDFQAPRILATTEIGGTERDLVIGSGKLGYVIAFDRSNGRIVWNTRVGQHRNDELASVPAGETIEVLPGVLGGVETPMSLAGGVVFVPVLDLPSPYTPDAFGAEDGTEAVANIDSRTDVENDARSHVAAIEVDLGRVLWKSEEFDQAMFSGTTVVNDLVFAATYDGTMVALDRETGEQVWSMQAPAGINAWPAVARDTIVWAAGVGADPAVVALRPSE